MRVNAALDQISEIHEQLARAHVCRDIKAVPVALSGGVAFAAMFLQPRILGAKPLGLHFIYYWMAIAVIGALTSSGGALYAYVSRMSQLERRRLFNAAGQFAPCIVAGFVVTAMMSHAADALIAWLPGIWTLFFAVGLFAARLNLPRRIGFAALYYLIAGTILLSLAPSMRSFQPWAMGLAFGIGQIYAGLILHWSLIRDETR